MDVPKTLVRFLNLLVAIRELSPFDSLDAEEELFLNDLIVRWSEQDQVMVRDLLSDNRYPSSATAYRRLASLHEKGLVSFQVPNEDKRLRRVLPTETALQYMKNLEAAVDQIASNKN